MIDQINDMKNRIDELSEMVKRKSDENEELKERVKSQREKINSLQMELEEEKGKTITVFDGGITMRADIWRIVDENKSLRDENKALKRRVENFEVELKSKIDNPKLHKEIIRLQDQHQQDCIRINELTTTVHVLAGLYSTLRKDVGMD